MCQVTKNAIRNPSLTVGLEVCPQPTYFPRAGLAFGAAAEIAILGVL